MYTRGKIRDEWEGNSFEKRLDSLRNVSLIRKKRRLAMFEHVVLANWQSHTMILASLLLPCGTFIVQLWLLVNAEMIIIVRFPTFTTCRRCSSFDLFVQARTLFGWEGLTHSLLLSLSLYYFYFITLREIDHRQRERERGEWPNERRMPIKLRAWAMWDFYFDGQWSREIVYLNRRCCLARTMLNFQTDIRRCIYTV